jgi:maltose-binding protein MalE
MAMVLGLAACGAASTPATEAPKAEEPKVEATEAAPEAEAPAETVELTMWFWGADDAQQAALAKALVEPFNAAHPGYNMTVEYRASVNKDMAVALAAGEGPDIVYESSGALALTYIQAGKYANLDEYAKKFGWQEKLLGCMYDSGVYEGSLYTVPMGMNAVGMVYNKDVLAVVDTYHLMKVGETAVVSKTPKHRYTPIYTVKNTECIDKKRRVVRIDKAMEAYNVNYLDSVNNDCYAGMTKALTRIEERIVMPGTE